MKAPDFEQRFARLERDLRRVRMAILLLLVVAAGLVLAEILPRGRANAVAVFAATALLLAGAEIAVHVWRRSQNVPEIVRAKKFEVVDDRGHIFVEIGETLDGRGAVVTHDGDTNVVLGPARPPIPGEPRSEHARAARYVEEDDQFDVRTGAPPRADTGAAAAGATPAAASNATQPAREPRDPGAVNVSLSYRGGGVYEAKITERERENGAEPDEPGDGGPAGPREE